MKSVLIILIAIFLNGILFTQQHQPTRRSIIYQSKTLNRNLTKFADDLDEDLYLVETTTMNNAIETTTTVDDLYENDEGYEDEHLDEDVDEDLQPYNCPSQCKCVFNKRTTTTTTKKQDDNNQNIEDEDNNEDLLEEEKRNRRLAEDNYDDELLQQDNNSKRASGDIYDIDVDCSSQNLNTIRNLFDDEFPLDQIVSFNLSHNKFRLLKLDDGFEDIYNLRQLDLSFNPSLRSPSPRLFLKKFRHLKRIDLNHLNQIQCLSDKLTGQVVSIDCRWFKTIAYLLKRNVSVMIDSPNYCDARKVATSSSLLSKCDEYLNNNRGIDPSSSSQAISLFQIDSMKFELKIEPELNQLLIEGDRLELTCRLKRWNPQQIMAKKSRLGLGNELNFYRTRLKWYHNDSPLFSSPPSLDNNFNLTTVNIYLTKHKSRHENILESKLIIANTKSTINTGQYTCLAMNVMNNENTNYVNGSKVDIKVLSQHELSLVDATTTTASPTRTILQKYCPEIVTQTYKGTYKWVKTLSSTKVKLKCAYQESVFDEKAPIFQYATYECDQNGQWSNRLNLDQCQYTSNLTRFLFKLQQRQYSYNLDDVIHHLVFMQSPNEVKSSLSSNVKLNAKETSNLINMYDVIFMQRYLNAVYNNRTALDQSSTRRQFMWLNDILARLSFSQLNRAQSLDSATFSGYFFNSLLPMIEKSRQHKSSDMLVVDEDYYYDDDLDEKAKKEAMDLDDSSLLSSYLAATTISSRNRTVCVLNKYQLSQQLYFKCDQNTKKPNLTSHFETFNNSALFFILFESDKLLPNEVSTTTSNRSVFKYDFNMISELNEEDFEDEEMNRNCVSQVVGLSINTTSSTLNLTIEIKMPDNYYTTLASIQHKLLNKTQMKVDDEIEIMKSMQQHPFDIVFHYPPPVEERQKQPIEQSLKTLYTQLANKWLQMANYEIIHGRRLSSSVGNDSIIDWQPRNDCQLIAMSQDWSYRLFATLRCQLGDDGKSIQFICLRHHKTDTDLSPPSKISNSWPLLQMVQEYAKLMRIDLAEKTVFVKLLWTKYQIFKHKIVYFASALSCLLLLISLAFYLCARNRLQMPRTFYHSHVNIWLCMLLLILTFTLGSTQVQLAHICLASAFLMHYFTLCAGMWYTLYFHCLFRKLNTLKKRNYSLIFQVVTTTKKPESTAANKRLNDNFGADTPPSSPVRNNSNMQRPVLHLYMLGWGVPLLLCAIIISITKRDYIHMPFNSCLTNQLNIVLGSILLPLVIMCIIQVIFIAMTWSTLRRIVRDLQQGNNNNNDEEDNKDILKSVETCDEDKAALCKNWNRNNNNINQDEDLIKGGEMVELKIDPVTQRSVIVTNNNNNDSFSSSFERDSSISDRTSIMDMQHKPNAQLKASICCFALFITTCAFAVCFVNSGVSLKHEIFAYLFSTTVIAYSIIQIVFYVLTRQDFNQQTSGGDVDSYESSVKCWKRRNNRKEEQQDDKIDTKSEMDDDKNNLPNWYFESRRAENNNLPIIQTASSSSSTQEEEDYAYESSKLVNNNNNNNNMNSICDVLFNSAKKEAVDSNNKLDSSVSPYCCNPTLAVQEETEDVTIPSQIKLIDMTATPVSTTTTKKQHVRNPSLLNGNKEQNMQILSAAALDQDETILQQSSNKSSATKRPVYVYVDHKYEEKIYQKLVTSTSAPVPVAVAATNNKNKNRINDLLWNKCSTHLGSMTASLVPPSSSNKKLDLRYSNNSNNACANSNGINSMTSSSISSSNEGGKSQENVYDDHTIYQRMPSKFNTPTMNTMTLLNKSSSSSHQLVSEQLSNTSSTLPHKLKQLQQQQPSDLLSLLKHETSV